MPINGHNIKYQVPPPIHPPFGAGGKSLNGIYFIMIFFEKKNVIGI